MVSNPPGIGKRGQSSPLGVILILAIVVSGTALTVALGAEAFGSTQNQLSIERAEKSMTQLDSQAAMVALGNSQVQEVSLATSSGDSYRVAENTGWMDVTYTNLTGGGSTTIMNESMGAIVYDNDDREIAYQGGGVWRSDGENNAVMVSPPEFHYREATLTLPLVTVSGDESIDGRAVISRNTSQAYFPNESTNGNFTNPLERSEVEVTVQSDYYRAWGTFFEQRTTGNVSYDHPNSRVTVDLVTPLQASDVNSAAASLAASGTFEVNGAAKSVCRADTYTDSYNSSGTSDDYCSQTPGNKGDVIYGNDIDISSGSGGDNFYGSLVSGGTVKVGNGGGKPDVGGDINYTTACQPSIADCQSRITTASGTVNQIDGIQKRGALDYLIRSTVEEADDSNGNGGTSSISGDTLDYGAAGPSDEVTIGPGNYYLDRIDASGKEIYFDTTSGNVTLSVREYIHLVDSDIEVLGDGVVFVYVEGAGPHTEDLYLDKDSAITNAGDDANQFRIFGQANFTGRIGSGGGGSDPAKYVGVIYAPPGNGGTGDVNLDFGEVYGGLVTGTTTINKGSIHYDEALREKQTLTRGDDVVRVTYLHISTNRVNVTS